MSSVERQQVLAALDRLQSKLVQREEWTHSDSLGNLRETLQSPLFSHILTLQHSIKQLRNQVRSCHKSAALILRAQRADQNRTSRVYSPCADTGHKAIHKTFSLCRESKTVCPDSSTFCCTSLKTLVCELHFIKL